MRWAALIVAAGRGTRFGRPKQMLEIAGLPMIAWSIRIFAALSEVEEIVIATEDELREDMMRVAEQIAATKFKTIVPGGATRQGSVYAALQAVSPNVDAGFVHDGARPLVRTEDVKAGMQPVQAGHASLLAIPVIDTIKLTEEGEIVRETLPRDALWAAQTPQFAMLDDLRNAHEEALRAGLTGATDDAMLLERIGVMVHIVPGSAENFKVTMPEDLARADALMRRRSE